MGTLGEMTLIVGTKGSGMCFWWYKSLFGTQKTNFLETPQSFVGRYTMLFFGTQKLFLTFWKVNSGKGGVQRSATQKQRSSSSKNSSSSNKVTTKAAQTTGKAVQTFSGTGGGSTEGSSKKQHIASSKSTRKKHPQDQQKQH